MLRFFTALRIKKWLENNSDIYGAALTTSPKTRRGEIALHLDTVKIPGVSQTFKVYTVLSSKDTAGLKAHNFFMELYLTGRWSHARVMAQMATGLWRGKLQVYYIMMHNRLNHPVPEGWVGVHIF